MGALNIKDSKVAEKARKLARLRGQSITEAVSQALDAALRDAGPRAEAREAARERRVDDIVRGFKARLKRGAPTPQQVLDDMYDKNGLPR
jgi:hypothetical protein